LKSMARIKKTIRASKRGKKITRNELKKASKKTLFRWGESYTSLLMGIVVVIIGVLFAGSIIKVQHIKETSSISTVSVPSGTNLRTVTQGESGINNTYTVSQGDSLWNIADKVYGSGYNWVDIARANHLENPNILNEGSVLIIPKATPIILETVTPALQNVFERSIKSNTYTVEKGDSLWEIAVRSYENGYRWVDIAKANNLDNPNLIFSGNVLKIPR